MINISQLFSTCANTNIGGSSFGNFVTSLQPNRTVMHCKTLKSRLKSNFGATKEFALMLYDWNYEAYKPRKKEKIKTMKTML